MKSFLRPLALGSLLMLGIVSTWADDKPGEGANLAAQSAADYLRAYTGAEGAFIHAGMLKDTFNKDDLATFLSYPTDGVEVLSLTGEQIRQAFELSVSLYPQSNLSFLQLSGFEVTFKKSGAADNRILGITLNGATIDNSRSYTVAMPMLLAKGAVGYFRIWGKDKTAKAFPKTTMEDVLKGKKATEGTSKWIAQA